MISLPFFQFMANLEQSKSQILVDFDYITINSDHLSYKNSNTNFTLLLWIKVLVLSKNVVFFFQKKKNNNNASKINGVLVLKGIF